MIYLIGQLAIWLMLTAIFAAVAGWAFAAQRSAQVEHTLRRDREHLMRDLVRLASEDAGASDAPSEAERELESLRRLIELRDGRIAELEHAAESARDRADDATSELAQLQRQLSQQDTDASELTRLRAFAEEVEAERAREIEVEPTPEPAAAPLIDEEALALQTWRLRYFEQRVQYLEGLARAAPPPEPIDTLPLEWRAREAEARASALEDELRRVSAPAPEPAAESQEPLPFASDADVDVLLRWRLLYLERRTAYLQAQLAERVDAAPPSESSPEEISAPVVDPDRWKWRARYLEARVRHLEQRLAEQPQSPQSPAEPAAAAPESVSEPVAAAKARPRGTKPAVLASPRNGAPDDFTLIDGVSLMQQSTLYSIGVFHFDQIAAWRAENVTWVDQYLRLGGRIGEEEWVEQAAELAREGPSAARRMLENEDV